MNQLQITTPASKEIEKALLRNIIVVGNAAIDESIHLLRTPDLFYYEENREVYKILMKMYHQNKTIDIFTISDQSPDIAGYCMELITDTTTAGIGLQTNADYINILQQKYVKRRSIEVFYDMQKRLFDPLSADYQAFYDIEKAYQQMSDIIYGKQTIKTMEETVQKSLNKLSERIDIKHSGKIPGVNTGLDTLDDMLAGWQNGELYVIAARPGMGKTALALHFAEHAALNGAPVLFFSLEMADYKLTDRMIIGKSDIRSIDYHNATFTNDKHKTMTEQAAVLSKLPIYFDEQSGIDIV
jgi:replicative DNA helicase